MAAASTSTGGVPGGSLHADNATITSNQAGVLKRGGGIFAGTHAASLQNTILAGNYEKSKLGGVPDDCDAMNSLDYNLVQTTYGLHHHGGRGPWRLWHGPRIGCCRATAARRERRRS